MPMRVAGDEALMRQREIQTNNVKAEEEETENQSFKWVGWSGDRTKLWDWASM